MSRRHARIVAGGHPFLVAEAQGAVVGYAYAFQYRDRAAYRFAVEDSIYVRPDQSGQGIGAALLDALIAASVRAGHRQMIAVIGDSANTASVRLHERAGFAHVGILKASGWKAGRWLDVVLMQRPLGDGERTEPG